MQRSPLVVALLLCSGLAACAAESAQAPRPRSPGWATASGAPPNTTYHCSPPEPGQLADCGWREDPPQEATVCNDEKATGSNISRSVCRSQEEAFRDDAIAKEWINAWQPNPARGESVHVGTDPFGRIYPE